MGKLGTRNGWSPPWALALAVASLLALFGVAAVSLRWMLEDLMGAPQEQLHGLSAVLGAFNIFGSAVVAALWVQFLRLREQHWFTMAGVASLLALLGVSAMWLVA